MLYVAHRSFKYKNTKSPQETIEKKTKQNNLAAPNFFLKIEKHFVRQISIKPPAIKSQANNKYATSA